MLNFAHGDVIMVGAFTIIVATNMSMPPVIAVLLAIVVCTVLGVTIEKLRISPCGRNRR